MKVETTCCFTGHRPHKLGGYAAGDNKELLWRVHNQVVDLIENQGVTTFISGMALGIDIWSALIVLKLKEKYNIQLVCAIPCAEQYSKWNAPARKEWEQIVGKADVVHYVSDLPYTNFCMEVRNRWMVNRSKYVIAVWDGTKGGTGNCVAYAKKNDKNILHIPVSI